MQKKRTAEENFMEKKNKLTGTVGSTVSEFKAFILKGNIIDMAVGVIIGGAFGKIVTSLVNDILMPALGAITGTISFSDLKWVIKEAELDAAGAVVTPETAILYGSFIQNIIDFLIIGVCIFAMVKVAAKVTATFTRAAAKEAEEKAPKGPTQEELLVEIRDLLKAKQTEEN
ncbi:MAG: large-conductance mechanosensitive channel protein MscL [Emergencia sp.]|nr:large-conductance mechanosensitive channel protein MscL [Emergencia sp.]